MTDARSSEQRLAAGGGNARGPAGRPGGRAGLERGLDGGRDSCAVSASMTRNGARGLIDTPGLQHVLQRPLGRDQATRRTEVDHVENRSIYNTKSTPSGSAQIVGRLRQAEIPKHAPSCLFVLEHRIQIVLKEALGVPRRRRGCRQARERHKQPPH